MSKLASGSPRRQLGAAALALGALGVVFGDIGTSPLYALQTVFSADHHAVKPTEGDVYGVISLVFWSITLIVSIEFVLLIMRADNDGEGGIMALIALVEGASLRRGRIKALLIGLGLFGVALFYGDGMITPAISVLSAVEGVKVVTPSLDSLVVPITIVVLVALFAIQRFGTHLIGRVFGPVMVVWFAVLAAAGLGRIVAHPAIVKALSPTYGGEFFADHPGIAFVSLGAIVLTITGAEALYADMGHFGRKPISRAWFFVVFPALTLNYMGQGSLILDTPSTIDNPFFLLIPHWGRMPMILLATVATVIASQAVISGAFSVTRQAVQLGFLPRLTIRHTSAREIGQIYVPAVNWFLLAAVVALVIGFGSSTSLASAYGIAVTGTITVDTLLFFVVVRSLWRKPGWLVALAAAVFFTVDLAFLGANLTKVEHGGWFPLMIGIAVFTVLSTWNRGREKVTEERIEAEGSLRSFVEELRAMEPPAVRVPGTAVYLNSRRETTPLALRAGVEHTRALHEAVVIISIETTRTPYVPESERLVVDSLGYEDDGIMHLTARFGFQDAPDVPLLLALAEKTGLECEIDAPGAVYFLSRISITPTAAPGMAGWRKRLFVAMARNAASPVEYFRLPRDRTITLGSSIEL
ncbi:MAG: system potassium uptake protein [Solirubrobacterales bacterium]|nr:system potassium uptake protein [Solirubrobacterales bacterium]